MRGWREPVLGCGLVVQLTITVVVAALVPLLLGIWLDRVLHSSPFVTMFMMLFGITIGTIAVYRAVTREYRRIQGEKR